MKEDVVEFTWYPSILSRIIIIIISIISDNLIIDHNATGNIITYIVLSCSYTNQ